MADRYHPILYVRGYAMTRGEMDDTASDPFCGFNLGSTTYRATPKKDVPGVPAEPPTGEQRGARLRRDGVHLRDAAQRTMAKYLNIAPLFAKTKRVDWMPEEAFPSTRFFCMVGTNRSDYGAAAGLSRTYLFQDSVIMEVVPPQSDGGDWHVRYDWQSDSNGFATRPLSTKAPKSGAVELTIPFTSVHPDRSESPSIAGDLRFIVSEWNAGA